MQILPVYREIIDFIAAGTTPQNLIDFNPSEKAKERIADLIYREKTTGLTLKRQQNSITVCSLSI